MRFVLYAVAFRLTMILGGAVAFVSAVTAREAVDSGLHISASLTLGFIGVGVGTLLVALAIVGMMHQSALSRARVLATEAERSDEGE